MTISPLVSTEQSEIQRLKALLPDALKSQIAVLRSTDVKPALIRSEKVTKSRFAIQIDLIRWQELDGDQRNLLFWHEVARVQNQTVDRFSWEAVGLGVGLGASLLELGAQNLVLFPIALTVAGLSGYQLYQRHRGERSLKEATAADRGAISLATQFGYSRSQAYASLDSALRLLKSQTSQKSHKTRYQVRLQVLEMGADGRELERQPLEIPSSVSEVILTPTKRQRKLAVSRLR